MTQKKTKVNKSLLEVHKPSGQISAKFTKSGKLHQLTPVQYDGMNFICYQAREQFHAQYKGVKQIEKIRSEMKSKDELFGFLANHWFDIDLNDLSGFLESHQIDNNKNKLGNIIKQLKSINVEMGEFKKHDLMVQDVFSMIRRYQKIRGQNRIKIMLEPEILAGWVFKVRPFKRLFLKTVSGLTHTYTKILYENLKDYEGINTLTKPLEQWNFILGFDNKSSKLVSTLKRDYLNKSIDEINEKTDLFIKDIHSKKEDGVLMMVVEFEKQSEKKLEELGLVEGEITVHSHKFYDRAKAKLTKLVKNIGYKVVDEDMWITTDINKNAERYESEIRIDAWLNTNDQDTKTEVYEHLAKTIDDCDDPSVVIDDYKIIGLFSRDAFTRNPTETIVMMNEAIEGGDD